MALFFGLSCANSAPQRTAQETTLTIGVPEAIAGAEFSLQNLASNLSLEGLAFLSPDGRAIPRIAESWSWDENGLVLRVKLRDGVTFHDGTPLTGAIVADALRKAIARPSNRILYNAFSDVEAIEAVDRLQVQFKLARHSAFLPEALEIPLSIGDPPVGTGPYRVEKRDAAEFILERNSSYHAGTPEVSRIVIRPFDALRTAWSSLLRGDVDMVTDVPPDAVQFVGSDDVQVLSFGRRYQYVVAFNSKRQPFHNPVVRRALNAAVDRDAVIQRVLQGYGSSSTGPLWPQHWAYDTSLPSFRRDPQLAVSLLERSGYAETTSQSGPPARLRFTCLIPANFAVIERIGLEVQKQLYDIGVDMQFEVVPPEDLDSRIRSGNFDALLIEMLGGPTLGRAYMFWGSSRTFQGLNVFGFENQDAERLFGVLRTTTNEAAVRSATRSLQQVLLDDPPALFIAWNQRSRAVRRDFEVVQDANSDPADPVYSIWRWRRAPTGDTD